MEAHKKKFADLIASGDERGCLKYIMKYDDFYDAITSDYSGLSMLQYACMYRLAKVALALIDKNCDLTHKNSHGSTALIYASCYELNNVTAAIIDKSIDTKTRSRTSGGQSEMMYLCSNRDVGNVIKMIDKGYDIYYKNDANDSLFTQAIHYESQEVVQKLLDIDIYFVEEFKILYCKGYINDKFYQDIMKYCRNKRDTIKREIIATMNNDAKSIPNKNSVTKDVIFIEVSPTNVLYQSFHTTYAVQLVNIICDFILLPIQDP